jgi:hypothetical protein
MSWKCSGKQRGIFFKKRLASAYRRREKKFRKRKSKKIGSSLYK